jgi:hypothetical protein
MKPWYGPGRLWSLSALRLPLSVINATSAPLQLSERPLEVNETISF